jgi:cytidine deaminase
MTLPQDLDLRNLVDAATAVRCRAHAPYSNYQVGAALQTDDGTVFTGCNVENASYGLTICAERCAVGSAIAGGKKQIVTMAICTEDGGTPCGACRQVLSEFGDDIRIVCVDAHGNVTLDTTIAKLLPSKFRRM